MSNFRFLGEPFWSRWAGRPLGASQQAGASSASQQFIDSLIADLSPVALWYAGSGEEQGPGVVSDGDGQPVTGWNDDAGSYNMTASDAPTFVLQDATLNNRCSVDLDGTNDYLYHVLASELLATANPYTIYVVGYQDAGTSGDRIPFGEANSGNATPCVLSWWNSNNARSLHRDTGGGGSAYNSAASVATGSKWLHVVRRSNATTFILRVNGAQIDSAVDAMGAIATNRLTIGCWLNLGAQWYFKGRIALVCLCLSDNFATGEPLINTHYSIY